MYRILARIVWLPALVSALAAQENVSLYLEPSTEGTVYFKEDLAKLNKRGPEPYPADAEVTEWMVVDYPGTYVGYVQPSAVNEDMTVQEGTAILLRPKADSRAIATVDGSFTPQVIELGPNWATVFYEGQAPAFFKWPSKRPPAPAAAEVVTVSSAPAEGGEIVAVAEVEEVVAPVAAAAPASSSPAPVAAPAAAPAATPKAPASSAPKPVPAPASSAPVAKSAPPELAPIAATPRPAVPVSPPPPPLTSTQVTRVWEGKLVRNKGLGKLFSEDYPYYLEDASGERIAYVDLSETLLFKPVENYWDTQVIIDGTAEALVDSTPVLIKARVLRPKF